MDRDALVRKLVLGTSLCKEERRALGAFVTREEIAAAMECEVERRGRFPVDAKGKGGLQIVLEWTGARLVLRRARPASAPEHLSTVHAAIHRYCGGFAVRSASEVVTGRRCCGSHVAPSTSRVETATSRLLAGGQGLDVPCPLAAFGSPGTVRQFQAS